MSLFTSIARTAELQGSDFLPLRIHKTWKHELFFSDTEKDYSKIEDFVTPVRKCNNNLKLGCLHPVACIRSGSGVFV
jgi:hypothetical protein